MIYRSLALRGTCAVTFTILLSLALSACGGNRPGEEPRGGAADTATVPSPPAAAPDTGTATTDTLSGTTVPDGPGPGPGATGAGPGWNRTELVQGMQRFITAIDSGDREMFWNSLSERSLRQIQKEGAGSRDEVWSTARQTLGDIQNRRITVIGGTADSVALLIDGLRMIDSSRQNDPVIVHLLHERGDWKVMYPGLLYPAHHLRK